MKYVIWDYIYIPESDQEINDITGKPYFTRIIRYVSRKKDGLSTGGKNHPNGYVVSYINERSYSLDVLRGNFSKQGIILGLMVFDDDPGTPYYIKAGLLIDNDFNESKTMIASKFIRFNAIANRKLLRVDKRIDDAVNRIENCL